MTTGLPWFIIHPVLALLPPYFRKHLQFLAWTEQALRGFFVNTKLPSKVWVVIEQKSCAFYTFSR